MNTKYLKIFTALFFALTIMPSFGSDCIRKKSDDLSASDEDIYFEDPDKNSSRDSLLICDYGNCANDFVYITKTFWMPAGKTKNTWKQKPQLVKCKASDSVVINDHWETDIKWSKVPDCPNGTQPDTYSLLNVGAGKYAGKKHDNGLYYSDLCRVTKEQAATKAVTTTEKKNTTASTSAATTNTVEQENKTAPSDNKSETTKTTPAAPGTKAADSGSKTQKKQTAKAAQPAPNKKQQKTKTDDNSKSPAADKKSNAGTETVETQIAAAPAEEAGSVPPVVADNNNDQLNQQFIADVRKITDAFCKKLEKNIDTETGKCVAKK